MAVGVVAAVANRQCCQHQATEVARRMPPVMLARARSRMATTMATLTGTAVMLTLAGAGAIAEQEVQGEITHLRKGRKVKR